MYLANFPDIEDFYKNYWGKKPFVAKGAIHSDVFETLIDPESLAALSLEEDVKSRIVVTAPGGGKWACDHGPFEENKFAELDKELNDKNWSLLVQNVEQYHTDTAKLLQSFNFAPRWLMDDIMVSYSTAGGSVGPHTDSYHVFLVQGIGRRTWKIGNTPVANEECIEGIDLKVLKDGFEGQTIDVSMGDVIYLPPHFAHEGITTENSLTFSVGFLGPQLSELFIEYGHHLEQLEAENKRFNAHNIDEKSSRYTISQHAEKNIKSALENSLQSNSFSKWIASYFSTPTYDDPENIQERDNPLCDDEIVTALRNGEILYKPDHIKLAITESPDGSMHLSVYGDVITICSSEHKLLITLLNENKEITQSELESLSNLDDAMMIITHLYNKNVLFFESEDLTLS